ncbi:hypothetical protein A4S02_10800 [Acetobacter ascendens]|uniref:Uncharacterized protein n=2 Tax=Acetobacter ascendens TaxID=481146 RepID=A0A1D8QXW4_9PROT|nr:hypothetical protein A4S02_10800 [Acetobacter ascendens]
MTNTNWPDPTLPGYPSWPEYYGEHVLIERRTGNKVPGIWNSPYAEWILPNGSFKAKNAANYYIYSHCACLGPSPISPRMSEILASERERAAKAATEVRDTYYAQREEAKSDDERIYADERMRAAQECAEAIRNLGATP